MALANMQKVIDSISQLLFQAESRRLAGFINDLDRQNRAVKGAAQQGFMFAGDLYMPTNATLVRNGPGATTLDYSLNAAMYEHLADKKVVETDKKLIEQILFKLLYPVNTLQDMRDVLPECLISLVPDLLGIPRHMPEAFLLADDARGMQQYQKIKPKIEFYTATRLLY